MKKFRKKPVVIEASEPLTPENAHTIADWAAQAEVTEDGVFIRTLEGTHHASWGDRVIRGVRGEFYPCKPDIFAATYEAVPWSGVSQGARGSEA